MKNVSLAQASMDEPAMPARVQEALGELVGSAKEGLLAYALHSRDENRPLRKAHHAERHLAAVGDVLERPRLGRLVAERAAAAVRAEEAAWEHRAPAALADGDHVRSRTTAFAHAP